MTINKAIKLPIVLCLILIVGLLGFAIACSPANVSTTATVTKTVTATAPAASGSSSAIEINYIFATPSPTSYWDKIGVPFTAAIEKATEGKVKFNIYWLGQLCPSAENYNSVVTGLADMAAGAVSSQPGRFSCLEVMQMPYPQASISRLSPIAWELYQTFPEIQKQFSEVHIISCFTMALPYQGCIATASKPITKLEDLKGLTISGMGTWTQKTITALGASTTQVSTMEIYTNLQKKVIDGARIDPGMLEDLKFQEVVKYMTLVNTGFVPCWFAMNLDKWNSLPDDAKKAFDTYGGYFMTDMYDSYTLHYNQIIIDRAIANYGVQVTELDAKETARWAEATKSVKNDYLAAMKADNLPGEKLLETSEALFAKYSTK